MMNFPTFLLLGTGVLALSACGPSSPSSATLQTTAVSAPNPSSAGVTAYQHSGFQGVSQSFDLGVYNAADLVGVGNDQISSLKVGAGLTLQVCEHDNALGLCREYGPGDVDYVGNDLNDKISYLKIGSSAPVPTACVGVTVNPGDNLSSLSAAHPEGTTFCLKKGLYRGVSVIPKAGQKFIGEAGTVLNGSKLLTGFARDGAYWKLGGQTQDGQRTGACLPDHPRCTRPEDLFLDNVPLWHVGSLAEVGAGKWYFDDASGTIYLGSDPSGHTLEYGVTRFAFAAAAGGYRSSTPDLPGVVIEGLIVEKYANPSAFGAIGDQYPSSGWTVKNCEVRLNHGTGIRLYSHSQALGNRVHHNGDQGFGGDGDDILVQDNESDHNLTLGFDPGQEGGGGKFSETRRLIYRHNWVHDNNGFGAWTDINNSDSLIEDNLVENNDRAGIMHEISGSATIRNNTVRGNGRLTQYVFGAEILISNSNHVEVYGNTVQVGTPSGKLDVLPYTRMGIAVYQTERPEYGGPHNTANNAVHGNTISYAGRQIWLERGQGMSASGIFSDAASSGLSNNTFYGNTYIAPDCNEERWFWVTPGPGMGSTQLGSFAQFQASGFETGGSCRTS